MITEKKCPACGKVKPIAKYSVHKKSKDGFGYKCRDCLNRWERQRKKRMGPLPEFKGKCQLCDESLNVEHSHIDHCHKTLRIRGILCRKCNVGLGMFRDNIHILYKAIVYLQKK